MFGKKDTDNTVAASVHENALNELSHAQKNITQLNAEVENLKDTVEGLYETIGDKEAHISDLKSRLARSQNSVNARVADALASINVPQFAIETICNSSVDASPEAIMRKFNSLPVDARHEFYKKHKDVIEQATRSGVLGGNT